VVIRPLAYVAERDLIRWAEHRQFPIIPCTLCGSQENLQRAQAVALLREWERKHPGRLDNMLHALQHIIPSHLMDTHLHDFAHIEATGRPDPEGDRAFDADLWPQAAPEGMQVVHFG
jgi:tRNA 2-thiocytidine biosynthesis protein TtcA